MKNPITGIDYDRLATLAKRTGARFEKVCERAEKGAQSDAELLRGSVRSPDADWLTTSQAAAYLAMTYNTFVSTLMSGDLDSFGLKYRSRSRVKPTGKRGCGVLYDRRDLDTVIRLRRATGSTTRTALRVFQAMRKGLLNIEFSNSLTSGR